MPDAGLGSKQQNFQQLPSNLSEGTMFVVCNCENRLDPPDRLDDLVCFLRTSLVPSTTEVLFECLQNETLKLL